MFSRRPAPGPFGDVRRAVGRWFARHLPGSSQVCVGLSGGADSLALAAAAVAEGCAVRALVVDHRLQKGSAAVAREAAGRAREFGCVAATVIEVDVEGAGGLEAAARRVRYAALDSAREGLPVLLGHTRDDQAETVLLGLARGSGPRSIRGMSEFDSPWGRPLLDVPRATTRAACEELGIAAHDDPHNSDPAFTRVRLRREVLPLLDDILGGGVVGALARTAAQLREDEAELDGRARQVLDAARSAGDGLDVAELRRYGPAVRRRVVRLWLLGEGVRGLTDARLRDVDALIARWSGQGGVSVPGGTADRRLVVSRQHGRLNLAREGLRGAVGPSQLDKNALDRDQ